MLPVLIFCPCTLSKICGKQTGIVANDAPYHSKWFLVEFSANVFFIINKRRRNRKREKREKRFYVYADNTAASSINIHSVSNHFEYDTRNNSTARSCIILEIKLYICGKSRLFHTPPCIRRPY